MKSIKASTYSVHFEDKGYNELNELIDKKNYSSIFILVDENSLEYCYPICIPFLKTEKKIETIEIKSGEIHKNLDTCLNVWNTLTDLGADRKSLLIALGGGVITDLGGFVAATYKRGIDFVNIPTTLLSMVDAAIGGKTGVDLGVVKNQIGMFVNPEIVIIDEVYLSTLNEREKCSGIAEIIKYGIIYDVKVLNNLKSYNKLDFRYLTYRSAEIKNEVVLRDPKESGVRKILNFGHTLGHAIESYFLKSKAKDTLTHGEAIAIGMVCELYLSSKVLQFPMDKVTDARNIIMSFYKKVTIERNDYQGILNLLKHDKKNTIGQVNFVLLNDFERYQLDCNVPEKLIIDSIEYYNS
ncbi:MAG: 3-dehydroquinate synthase [Flavobacterium sp. SCGC AAA160-P02]|nr:MAG: 3-dehydroquinate synthase [Flavobacterium sp. SCGC AAA160-P02]